MIRDTMVHFDGSPEDDIQLEHGQAVASNLWDRRIRIFTNALPRHAYGWRRRCSGSFGRALGDSPPGGRATAQRLTKKLASLNIPSELRRLGEHFAALVTKVVEQARCADHFIATRRGMLQRSSPWCSATWSLHFPTRRSR